MPYKLYTDRNENFECEVSVKNASLKGSMARLIVESFDGPNLVFYGKLDGDKCMVPIKRLKGLLDENTRGNMYLEVIVEDTYFAPWKSDFVVEEHTSVKVKVNESNYLFNKPIVEVKSISKQKIQNKKTIDIKTPLIEISYICNRFGIKKKNILKRKEDLSQILKEYFNLNMEYKNYKSVILSKLPKFME